ncbi:hypothetical protein E3N88_27079 [Mikania micrantha]|uniref:RRM domain-containing protein n=1 Tax=Mikania micrantha TaxID=192012 RepID=A0A5N6MVU4_9ASTR|nr:hypothetical protein E3N88_27079 [Mikania micrantha]
MTGRGTGEDDDREGEHGGWQKYRRKNTRRTQHNANSSGLQAKKTITFYVSNLPEDCNAMELAKEFGRFGTVSDVYVAARKDKSGSFFGFVRLPESADTERLVRSMNEVKMGSLKLSVNIARYEKRNKAEDTKRNASSNGYNVSSTRFDNLQRHSDMHLRDQTRSYKDVLLKKRVDQHDKKSITVGNLITMAMAIWSNVSLVGKTLNLTNLCNIETILEQERKEGCSIRYLGGLNVLLTFNHKSDAERFISCKEKWSQWFSNMAIWNGQSLPMERIAWLRIWGIPPQLWENTIMNKIGEKFGKVVCQSEASTCDTNLTLDAIGVLVSDIKPISEEIIIHWKNKQFRGWIEEDKRNWVPDFVNGGSLPEEPSATVVEQQENARGDEQPIENEEATEINALHADVENEGAHNNVDIGESALIRNTDNPNTFRFSATREQSPAQDGENNKDIRARLGPNDIYGPNMITDVGGIVTRKRRRMEDSWADPTKDVSFEYSGALSFSVGAKENRGTVLDLTTLDLNTPPVGGASRNCPSEEQTRESHQLPADLTQKIDDFQHAERNLESEIEATITMGNAIGVELDGYAELVKEAIEVKVEWIKNIRTRMGIHFISIQETQLTKVEDVPFAKIFEHMNYDAVAVPSNGRSGGIACCWDPAMFKKNQVKLSQNYIVISGEWMGVLENVNLVNVYAPHGESDRRQLWQELLQIKNTNVGSWIIMGDFNTIRISSDRSSGAPIDKAAKDFNEFIMKAELGELNMYGGKYTWVKDDGSALSKLDRFLLCKSMIHRWPMATTKILDRKWSDHKPIVLIAAATDFGPSPFRFYNSWLLYPELFEVVNSSWKNHTQLLDTGAADYNLSKKLKALKIDIKKWVKEKKEKDNRVYTTLEKEISMIEAKAESTALSTSELEMRRNAIKCVPEDDSERAAICMGCAWAAIVKLGKDLQGEGKYIGQIIRRQVGDGSKTLFWKQSWFGQYSFKQVFPNLFALEKHKNCKVSQRIRQVSGGILGFNWEWRRTNLNSNLSDECSDLEEMIRSYPFKDGSDTWVWNGEVNGEFSTHSCRAWFNNQCWRIPSVNTMWLKWVPAKVNSFVWRVSLNRVPVRVNLLARGVNIPTSGCPLCSNDDEDVDHLFFNCPVAQETWRRISWWLDFDFTSHGSIYNMLSFLINDNVRGWKWKVKMVVAFATIWEIWNCRNKRIFSNTRAPMDCLVDEIKLQAFTWITHRGKKITTIWDKWMINPWEGIVML